MSQIIARCPQCNRAVKVPEDLFGQAIQCPSCNNTFLAPALESSAARAPTYSDSPGPWADTPALYTEDSRDRRVAYGKPDRSVLILTLGILGLVICGPLGIAAWVMGNTDLAAIRRGEVDRTGEGMTRAGQILGIVSTVLFIVQLVVLGLWITFVATVVASRPRW
jgi:hypothetical protein